jgi:phosphoglycerate dehydrogenase-like enzyme
LDPEQDLEENVKVVSLSYLLKNSDAISLHVPLSNDTLGLIGESELRLMKDQSVLVNLSRGGVVCESALYKALRENRLAGAAFDVFEYEPENSSEFNSDLMELRNFFCTPHIAGTSNNTIKELGLSAIDGLIECLKK